MPSYYRTIKGKKYDRELLEQAEQAISGKGDGRISLKDAQRLLASVKDNDSYTEIEKATMHYIRDNFKFTEEANAWFRKEIRSWAAKRGNKSTASKSSDTKTAQGSASKKKSSAKKTTGKSTQAKQPKQTKTQPKTKTTKSVKSTAETVKAKTAQESPEQSFEEPKEKPEEFGSTQPWQNEDYGSETVTVQETKPLSQRWYMWLLGAIVFLLIIIGLLFLPSKCNRQAKNPVNDQSQNTNKKLPKSSQDNSDKSMIKPKVGEKANKTIQKTTAKKKKMIVHAKKPVVKNIKTSQNTKPQQKKKSIVANNAVYVVQKGDTLVKIAKKLYGSELKWRIIYNKNKNLIKNPDEIFIGQKLDVK